MRNLMLPILLCVALMTAVPARAADVAVDDVTPSATAWRALEQEGVRIAGVEVVVRDVYPARDTPLAWYERLANAIHIQTRDGVVVEQLLFKVGDAVDARRIYETERRLRALTYLREAVIEPGARTAEGVVARIVIDDAWSLKFSVTYDSTGGQTSSGITFQDTNFLGTGKALLVSRSKDVARTSDEFEYTDPALFGSFWTMQLKHKDLSDGTSSGVELALPFVTNDAPWAFDLTAFDLKEDVSFYNLGEVAYHAPSTHQSAVLEVGRLLSWSGDAGWRTRFGMSSDQFDYGALIADDPTLRPPPNLNPRQFTGVTWSIDRYHDHFEPFRNLRQVDRFEDYNLGLDARFALGWFPASAGSSVDAATAGLTGRWAGRIGAENLLFWTGDFSLREEQGNGTKDGFGSTAVTYYERKYAPNTLVVHAQADWREDPDPEHELYLGGFDGLFGYPGSYRFGDRRWTAHIEDRWLTDTVLFNTFRVGYAGFAEVGQIRALDTGAPLWSKRYADIGGGFRIGNLRGAFGHVLYFMVAVPLVTDPGVSNYQFVIGDVIDF